jgi:hypothetical protein
MQIDKKHIVKFLQAKRRGIYTLLVEVYADVINSMGKNMALEVIKEDLEKVSETKIELNYFSLAQAISRYRKKTKSNPEQGQRKWEFKDVHELPKNELTPGRFRLNQRKP